MNTTFFTSGEIITIITALGVLLTAFGTVLVNVIGALRKDVVKVSEQAAVIAAHVNSAATAATAKIDALQAEVSQLRATTAEKSQIAALLAQAASGQQQPEAQPEAQPQEVKVINTPSAPVLTKPAPRAP